MVQQGDVMVFVATSDATRSRDFYERVLGLTLVEDDGFALVFDLKGTMLRVQKVESVQAAPYTALGWQVDDIAATIAELSQRGVSFMHFDGMGQDASGIWTAPGSTARVAWFKDPDDNVLSLTQF